MRAQSGTLRAAMIELLKVKTLATLAVVLDDCLRFWLFREEKPRYRVF